MVAYEARRRGFDVRADANPSWMIDPLSDANSKDNYTSMFRGGEWRDVGRRYATDVKYEIDGAMKDWGDGTRAMVEVTWKDGCGHVFIAERIGGKTVYVDPQSNSLKAERHFSRAYNKLTRIMRVDNLKFSDKVKQCAYNGGRK